MESVIRLTKSLFYLTYYDFVKSFLFLMLKNFIYFYRLIKLHNKLFACSTFAEHLSRKEVNLVFILFMKINPTIV